MTSLQELNLWQTKYEYTTLNEDNIALQAIYDYVHYIKQINDEWVYGTRCRDGVSGNFPKYYVQKIDTSWVDAGDTLFVAYYDFDKFGGVESSHLQFKQGYYIIQ